MEFDELFTKLKVNPLKLIESIVHADGSSVILFKNRKSEIFLVKNEKVSLFHFVEKRLDFLQRNAIILLNEANTIIA